jgi:UDP-N-acetylmuramate--alanine ligase
VPDKAALPDAIEAIVRPGDVVIALGAGDVNASVRALKARLEAREASMGAEVVS